jgi:Two component regulator propeller
MAPIGHKGCYGHSIESCRLVAWSCLFTAVTCCVLYSRPVFSQQVPVWAVFTQENSDLLSDSVVALALGADGSLWAGTFGGGLARLGKDGHWQTYSKASTQGGLPGDRVKALALGADGSLWAGTDSGGLARLDKDGHWQTYSQASTKGGLPLPGIHLSAKPKNHNADRAFCDRGAYADLTNFHAGAMISAGFGSSGGRRSAAEGGSPNSDR